MADGWCRVAAGRRRSGSTHAPPAGRARRAGNLVAVALDAGEREPGRRGLRSEAAADGMERTLRRAARVESAAAACRHVVDGHPGHRCKARRLGSDRRPRRCQSAGHHGGRWQHRSRGCPRRRRGSAGARPAHAGWQLHRHVHRRDCAEALRDGLSRPGNTTVVDPRWRRRCDRDHQRERQHRILEPQRRTAVRLFGRRDPEAQRAGADARAAFVSARQLHPPLHADRRRPQHGPAP